MGQENNGEKKTLLQKLKRLMTVTESQAIEEEKAKLAQAEKEAASQEDVTDKLAEKPVLKLIENAEVVKETVIENALPIKREKPQQRDKSAEKAKEAAQEIIEDVKASYEKSLQEKKDNDITAEQMPCEPPQREKAEEKAAEKEQYINELDIPRDVYSGKLGRTISHVQATRKETLNGNKNKQADEKKKASFSSFVQAVVTFGQVLNEKADEYEADDFTSDEQNAVPDKKEKKEQTTGKEKNTHQGQSKKKKDKNKPLQNLVDQDRMLTKQLEQDAFERAEQLAENQKRTEKISSVSQKGSGVKEKKPPRAEGEIVIEGDSLPMYAYEEKSPRINIEIGKLSPILTREYEAYIEPEQLQARKAKEENKDPVEVITQATTSFNALVSSDEDQKGSGDDASVTQANSGNESFLEESEESKGSNIKQKSGKQAKDKRPKEKQGKQKAKKDKSALKKADSKEEKTEKPQEAEKEDKRTIKEKLFGGYKEEADYSAFTTPNDETIETIDDFESPQDAKAVRAEINFNLRRLFFRCLTVGILFILCLALAIIQRAIPEVLTASIPNVDIMFCIVNFLLLIIAAAVSSVTMKNGLTPLWSFRGNSDTAVSVAAIAVILQCVISLFNSRSFFISGGQNLYTLLVLFALLLNAVGKFWIVLRVKENFKFVSADRRKYAVKILTDEKAAEEMIEETNAEEPIVAFQRRTKFLKNFLRLSYAPDPSEKVASRFAPVCVAFAVVIAIIHGIVYQSVAGAISSFALVACVGIPVCSLLAVNIPMRKLCKEALHNDAMIVGYPAVKQFCDTSAVMIDSRELYPRTSVELVHVKPFISYNLEQAVLNAAAVMKVANTSMTYVFEDIIRGRYENLPIVESVKYEEKKGLVGWVGGERVLIGTRELLKSYGIEPPSLDFEEPYIMEDKQVTYLANAGQLIAMLVTSYTPDTKIKQAVSRLEQSGISILIRTADTNVTCEQVALDFSLHRRSVRILPNSLGNICKDEISLKEEESRAYIATRGKMSSLSKCLAGCIKIKNNISLAITVQFISVVLGIVIAAIVSVLAGVGGFGAIEMFIYMLFWAVAAIVVPLLQRW